jgi:hypothetical protein
MEDCLVFEKLRFGLTEDAHKEASSNLSVNPSSEHWFQMGVAKLFTNDWDYAIMCFAKAKEIPESRLGLAACMVARGQGTDACGMIMSSLVGLPIRLDGIE